MGRSKLMPLKHKLRFSSFKRNRSGEGMKVFLIFFVTISLIVAMMYITMNANDLMSDRARQVGTLVIEKLPKPPPPAVPMSRPDGDGDHFTRQLWRFQEPYAEKLFLYQHFLTSTWQVNATNLQIMRTELSDSLRMPSERGFLLTQLNTPENTSLVYYLGNKPTKRKKIKQFRVPKELREYFPVTSPLVNSHFQRCSLVGNSGILQNSGCGREIDRADFVFRCNAAPLEPFRNDAGRKSNLTTMNPSLLRTRYGGLKTGENATTFVREISQYNGFLWLPCFGLESHRQDCLTALMGMGVDGNASSPRLIVGNPDHFRSVTEFWKQRKFGESRLSTGFYLAHIALSVCDETHLYGFWPFLHRLDPRPGDVHDVPYHYFDNLKMTKAHDMSQEFQVLLQMHEQGLLQLHTGRCGS